MPCICLAQKLSDDNQFTLPDGSTVPLTANHAYLIRRYHRDNCQQRTATTATDTVFEPND